jgi:hypothetical protein
VHWHIADDVLDWPNVRYVSKFSAPTYLDERPESAHLTRCGAFRRSSPF